MACGTSETSEPGGPCVCLENYGRNSVGECVLVVEQCVVNERVPLFALKLDKQEVTPATTFASREEGGVCHMQRLMQVNNHLPCIPQFDSGYSAQVCEFRCSFPTHMQPTNYPPDAKAKAGSRRCLKHGFQ